MSVTPFRPVKNVFPSRPLPIAARAAHVDTVAPVARLDLSGKRKAWFLIGRGRIGKTTTARWLVETALQRGATSTLVAAADPTNRSLREFLDDVSEPPTTDPGDARDWLRDLLQHCMDTSQNAVIDLGGGNTTLTDLLAEMPDLAAVASAGGLEPVAVHVIGGDVHDLVPLAATEAAGFQPDATVIILNERHGRRERFDQVREHPAYKTAIARGAVEIWMPTLSADAAALCDTRAWHYLDVKNVAGPFTASAVQSWLRRMETAFAPIATWLPEG